MAIYANLKILPDDYQEVEYIESTGTQYIDMKYTYKVNDILNIDFMLNSTTGAIQGVFGNGNLGPYIGTVLYIDTNNVLACSIGGFLGQEFVKYEKNPIAINKRYNVRYEQKDMYLDGVKAISVTNELRDGTQSDFSLFRRWGTNGMNGRIYNFSIKRNGEYLFQMFPCYRKSDNEIGLYDTVNNVFYTNKGTGTFLKGENTDTVNNKPVKAIVRSKNNLADVEASTLKITSYYVNDYTNIKLQPNTVYTLSFSYAVFNVEGKVTTEIFYGTRETGVAGATFLAKTDVTNKVGTGRVRLPFRTPTSFGAYANADGTAYLVARWLRTLTIWTLNCRIYNIMIQEGKEEIPYEPYNQLFTVPIKKIYTNTRTVTFNGTENWQIYPCEKGQRVYLDGGVPPFKAPQSWVVMENASSNYYNVVSANGTYQGIKGISFEGTKRIHFYDSEHGQSLSKWKSYLAELAAQGNPLSITYESTEAVVIGYEY